LYASRKTEKTIYESLDGASLKNVALMVHSRTDIEGAGFEFVHKSFGEYLAARALIGIGQRINRQWQADEFDGSEQTLALNWVDMIGAAEMSNAVLRFLKDEARLHEPNTVEPVISTMSMIFDWTLVNGFPANTATGLKEATYREIEHRQKCAETCFLCTLTSFWAGLPEGKELLPVNGFKEMDAAASNMLDRLFRQTEIGSGIDAQLLGFDLSLSDFYNVTSLSADFSGATLTGAMLNGARLDGAKLQSTDLSDCSMGATSLRSVDCTEIINLTQGQVKQSFGVKQGFGKTLLPDDLVSPDHWHVADETNEDTIEIVRAYNAAYRLWKG